MPGYLIIAGTGSLPRIMKEHQPDAKVIGFASDKPDIETDILVSFGEIGRILNFAKEHDLDKIVFAGGMQKPNLSEVKPDAEGAKLLAKIVAGKLFSFGRSSIGDDSILSKVIEFLESRGFKIVGANEVASSIVSPSGLIAGAEPTAQMLEDIKLGMEAARNLGRMDIGQAVVVENGVVLATENIEGTPDLIARAGELKKDYGGVLVKACKPQQDIRIDLPSIGEKTVIQAAAAGIAAIAVESGKSLLLDKEELITRAGQCKVTVFGA